MTGSTERFPDFFIVGHPKSGTTALYEMLDAHPQVFMSRLKEPRWFSPDMNPRLPEREIVGHRPELPQSREEYLALFEQAGPGMVLGEASTSYLRSEVAAGLIARERPDARIVALFREPVSFLRSMQLELVQSHVETERDLATALEREDQLPPDADGRPRPRRYSDRVRYVEQLRRFHEAFGREQVLALIYEDFRADNEGTMRRVLRFLGVSDEVEIRGVTANPTVAVRHLGADRAFARLQGAQGPLARGVKGAIRAGRLDRPIRRARRRLLYAAPSEVDQQLVVALRRRFLGEVQAFGEYLGRDLVSLWGYEQLD